MASTNITTGGFEVLADERAVPLFTVVHYLKEYDRYLDSKRFAAMRLDGDKMTVLDVRNGKQRDSAVGVCVKRWRHCGGRSALLGRCVHAEGDSPFIRCFEKLDYER